MKRIFFILMLAVLGMTQVVAQEYEYVPFVREGVKWICDDPHLVNDNPYLGFLKTEHNYFTLELSGDSVIDGKSYIAMHKYSGEAIDVMNDTIPVFLREENKVVYGIVPDGKTYTECPVGMNWWPEAQQEIREGKEFVLYDFNDPINFIKDNIRYPVQGSPDGFYVHSVLQDKITVAGKKVNRYIFDSCCIIEGIGFDGMSQGYPLSAFHNMLCHVIENGDTIYTSKSLEITPQSVDDEELPIPRQGVQWVNERVTVENGDTSCYYYKYEFRGCDSQGFAYCYSYTGETFDNSDAVQLVAEYQCWDYGLDTSNGMIRYNSPFKKVVREGRDMVNLYSSIGFDNYWEMYKFDNYVTDIDPNYTLNWYIYRQKEPFLTRENFVEVEPLIIEGIKCKRFAHLDEQGDTLLYIVQGIGFDSRDMGDLLTPFTRKPDPNADYQEWCGLSHVVKDGQIIYKGMRYRDGAHDGINEVAVDRRRLQDTNYYDLMGRPVGNDVPTTPGIYIHQGKKIVVR